VEFAVGFFVKHGIATLAIARLAGFSVAIFFEK